MFTYVSVVQPLYISCESYLIVRKLSGSEWINILRFSFSARESGMSFQA
jgi:hypothetical protein